MKLNNSVFNKLLDALGKEEIIKSVFNQNYVDGEFILDSDIHDELAEIA